MLFQLLQLVVKIVKSSYRHIDRKSTDTLESCNPCSLSFHNIDVSPIFHKARNDRGSLVRINVGTALEQCWTSVRAILGQHYSLKLDKYDIKGQMLRTRS